MRKQMSVLLLAMSMGLGATACAQQRGANEPAKNSTDGSKPIQSGQTSPSDIPGQATNDFKADDLKKFAGVQKPLEEIRTDYSQRLQSTQEPEKAAQLQEEASQKMMEVVKGSGLEVETYNQIAMAVQNDPELQAKVQSMMN